MNVNTCSAAAMIGVGTALCYSMLIWRTGNFGALRTILRGYKVTREVKINGKLEKITQTIIPISRKTAYNLSYNRLIWLNRDKSESFLKSYLYYLTNVVRRPSARKSSQSDWDAM